jgi:hypothetical protein
MFSFVKRLKSLSINSLFELAVAGAAPRIVFGMVELSCY